MKMFKCKMEDGSEFVMPKESWQKALKLKYGRKAGSSDFKEAFTKKVDEYWRERKVPTKFDWDEDWDVYFEERRESSFREEQAFENQADPASVVMYYLIRAPLFSVALQEMGTEGTSVIGIGKEELTVYDGESTRHYKDLDDIFKKEKRKKKPHP